ncbi:MAG: hypothetical protein MUF49_12470 [Oculatellaceae cyanobacterium Prado106]|jgi:hypothetical protein|nr:hypothetical protein [Oculatellaceae cyanobacterium Prado106]
MKAFSFSLQSALKFSFVGLSALCILAPSVQAVTVQSEPSGAIAPSSAQTESLLAQEMGCPRAMPVAYFATSTFHVSICQGQDGYLFYRGVEFANTYNAINVPTVTDYGDYYFDATNGNVTYSINPQSLTVWQNGEIIWQEDVISYSFE